MSNEPRLPVRPSISPLVWMAFGTWSGILVAEGLTWRTLAGGSGTASRGSLVPAATYAILTLAAAILLAGSVLRRRRGSALLGLGLTAGLAVGLLFWWWWPTPATPAQSIHGDLEVTADASTGPFGASSAVSFEGRRYLAQWPQGEVPEAGEQVGIAGALTPGKLDAAGRRLHQQGTRGRVRVRVIRVRDAARSLRGVLLPVRSWARQQTNQVPGEAGALLAGVVTGDRRRLSGSQLETDFKTCGLTHLVAVSGSHLVVVAACVAWMAGALAMRPKTRALAVTAVCGTYVVFSGIQTSAVRAWLMATIAFIGPVLARRSDPTVGLAAAAAGMLLVWPPAAFDLGFQLSILAVAGLLVLGRISEAWTAAALPRALRGVAAPASMTLVACLVTLPVTAGTFGMISIVSPIANLVVGPIVEVAIAFGLAGLAVSALVPPLGWLLLNADGALLGAGCSAAHRLAALPHAAVPSAGMGRVVSLAIAALAASAWALWPTPSRRKARLGAAGFGMAVALFVSVPFQGHTAGPTLTVLDVGQGDAILVRDSVHSILVDTGPSPIALRHALARFSVRSLDAVVITHEHADHNGGVQGLEGVVKVGTYFVGPTRGAPNGDTAAPPGTVATGGNAPGLAHSQQAISEGARLQAGGWELDVLSPPARGREEGNAGSVVILARYGSFSALLVGDAESEVLERLQRSGSLPDVDVLKIGHHGSNGCVTRGELAVLTPDAAVISVGAGNRFGHPTRSTLEVLARASVPVLRTDLTGDVSIDPRLWERRD